MALSGLVLVGTFLGVEQVRYGATHEHAGDVVPGFYKFGLSVGEAWDGAPMARWESYNATDRDSGEPTRFASEIGRVQEGDRIAVRVSTKLPRAGGRYVELVPTSVIPFAAWLDSEDEDAEGS